MKMQSKICFWNLLMLACAMVATTVRGASTSLSQLYRAKDFELRRESSANPDLQKNGDARSIEPGQTLILADIEGPGIISHLWFTVGASHPFYPSMLTLRAYWDGSETPGIECPLGDFFGVGFGAMSSYQSLPVTVSSHGRALNCWWKMPFKKRARLTVTNDSATDRVASLYFYLDWQKYESLEEDALYFHARYRQAFPAQPGDYTILETSGRGHYVGTVHSAMMVENGWYGEGDDRFYIDGETTPSLRGTGTEDYFGDAWGFRPFSYPYNGVSLWEGYFPGDRATAYRWHIEDPITFKRSLKVEIEHRGSVFNDLAMQLGSFIERSDWVSSVAYWYQDSPACASWPAMPPYEKRLPPYRILRPNDLEVRAEPSAGLNKGKDQILYLPRVTDAKLELEFEVAAKGRYQISAQIMRAIYSGRYQAFLDDQLLGEPRDFGQEGADPVWERFDLRNLEPGKHVLRFEGRGDSAARRSIIPATYGIGINCVVLLRLEDVTGYHDALKPGSKKESP